MELDNTVHETIKHEELIVHSWRAAQFKRLGIPESLAERYADHLDWHQVAHLVDRGCPPLLALRIILLRGQEHEEHVMSDYQRPGRSQQAPQGPGATSKGVDWREQAACRDVDPELFFPVGTTGPTVREIDEAKRICHDCSARKPCLDWALRHNVASGVWGGTTEEERHAIRTTLIHQRNRT